MSNRTVLVLHEKWKHRAQEKGTKFECGRCRRKFDAEGQRFSQKSICTEDWLECRRTEGSMGVWWVRNTTYVMDVKRSCSICATLYNMCSIGKNNPALNDTQIMFFSLGSELQRQ